MQMRPESRSRAGLLIALLMAVFAVPATAQFQKPYEIVPITDDVFAIVWQDITSFPVEGNHLVIINEHDVVVVDANRTPSLADTVIAIIRRRTDNPVRYVVNTHWHADHVQGNAVYIREFPGVAIIGHPETTAGIDTVLVPYVAEVRADVETARDELAADTAADGTPLTDAQRQRLDARLRNLERENTLYDAVTLARPTLILTDSITLIRGGRRIQIIHPGHGNTPGDLVVYLPEEGILALGDLVTRPFPFMGYDAPGSWYRALDGLLARAPRVVLPGHGEVMETMEYVELFRDFLRDLSTYVREGLTAGQSLEELQQGADFDRYWRVFAGDDERRFQAFAERFEPFAVERAYKELRP